MATGGRGLNAAAAAIGMESIPDGLRIAEEETPSIGSSQSQINHNNNRVGGDIDGGVHITCFSDVSDDGTLHFQIIRLHKQVRL